MTWVAVRNFMGWQIPIDVILKEPLFFKINQKFKILRGGVLRLEKNKIYNWHKDEKRGLAINMLLSGRGCHTIFGEESEKFRIQYDILELKYQPKKFYLFNTQIEHCVINFNEQERYLFSLEFEQEMHNLSYETLLHWKKQFSV